MVHDHSTRFSEIADLGSPMSAPKTIRFSARNERIFQIERSLSFPGGRAKEQGGTIVADKDGILSIQNLGGMFSTKGTFYPNVMLKDPLRFKTVGMLHTHPYDHTEGSFNGVSFSGQDVAHLINNRMTISVVQSGPRVFALLRTARSPTHLDYKQVDDAQNAAIKARVMRGRTFQQASRIEAELTAPRYGLAYYQGRHGVLTRVSPH